MDLLSPKITLYNIKSLIKIRVALGINNSADAQYHHKSHCSSLLVGSFPTQGGIPKCNLLRQGYLDIQEVPWNIRTKLEWLNLIRVIVLRI